MSASAVGALFSPERYGPQHSSNSIPEQQGHFAMFSPLFVYRLDCYHISMSRAIRKLLDEQLITQDQFERATMLQSRHGKTIGYHLVNM
jgi:hypothetical protein